MDKLVPEESNEKFSGTTTKSERFGDKGRCCFVCEDSSAIFSFTSTFLPGFTAPCVHSGLSDYYTKH